MTDTLRWPDELGRQLPPQQEALGLSPSKTAVKSGKVCEVVCRLDAGEDTTGLSWLTVLGGWGLAMRLESVGPPPAGALACRFPADVGAA